MNWKKYKYIYSSLSIIFIFSIFSAFYFTYQSDPLRKPETPIASKPSEDRIFEVTKDTEINFIKVYEVCERYNLTCDEANITVGQEEREKLNGLNINEIAEIYQKEQGWRLEKTDHNSLTLFYTINDLCPSHKKIWHLGENNTGDYVTVYYGPREVKADGGIFRVTEIPIKNLPLEYQEKVKVHSIEFLDEDELIATLDSLSEFLD